MVEMKDRFGREIDYLRISVTDRCNLKCIYCMPDQCIARSQGNMLSDDELLRIVRIAAGSGIKYFRLTGGEPLLRPGLSGLVSGMKKIPGLQKVTLTTNGTLLYDHAEELSKAGIDGINVSLDTTDKTVFSRMTGISDGKMTPQTIIEGIDRAVSFGIPVKVNTVLTEYNKDSWFEVAQLAREKKIDVRFIELMPIGCCDGITGVSNIRLFEEMKKILGKPEKYNEKKGNGPAVYFRFPGYLGCIGFISALHEKFCRSCNRLRLTADGELKPCLCFDDGIDLHSVMIKGADDKEIAGIFSDAVLKKPLGHCFEKPGMVSEKRSMVQIGG